MNVLVTGAAGYIGSHAVKALRHAGHEVVAVDNLDRGHAPAIPDSVVFERVGLHEEQQLRDLLVSHKVECVMHFAALAYVGESMEQPLRYYHNNTAGSLALLRAVDAAAVPRLVFSSTCATYGTPAVTPITEDTPQNPINPYGRSKLFVEHALADYARARPDFAYGALRYFNVAGCAADGTLGEDHDPETHLIPVVLLSALGRRDGVTIHGDDYETPDGTCIRDYLHVEDLVEAHLAVMDALQPGDQRAYNLGIGRGYSVREVVEAARRVTGAEIPVSVGPRRPGDPPELYADPSRIQREIGWQPRYTDLDEIIRTAWAWFREHPNGYDDHGQR